MRDHARAFKTTSASSASDQVVPTHLVPSPSSKSGRRLEGFQLNMQRLQRMFGGAGGAPADPDAPLVDSAEQIYISSLALLKMLKHGSADEALACAARASCARTHAATAFRPFFLRPAHCVQDAPACPWRSWG